MELANTTQSRGWVFVLNNPTINHIDILEIKSDYTIFQLEEGKECKTPHYQGYMYFKNKIKMGALKKRFSPDKPKFIRADGTAQQNKTYCTKEDTRIAGPWESGIMPEQGKRNDLLAIAEEIKAHVPMREIAINHPSQYIRYNRGLHAYRELVAPVPGRTTTPTVIVLWGPSGTGKSHKARELAETNGGGTYFLDFRANGQVDWTGYEQQKNVIINDYYGSGIKWKELLKLLDKYPNKVSRLYGSAEFTSDFIYFTSNVHPRQWYMNIPNNDSTPLMRRITYINHMTQVRPECVIQCIPQPAWGNTGQFRSFNEMQEEKYAVWDNIPAMPVLIRHRSESEDTQVIEPENNLGEQAMSPARTETDYNAFFQLMDDASPF